MFRFKWLLYVVLLVGTASVAESPSLNHLKYKERSKVEQACILVSNPVAYNQCIINELQRFENKSKPSSQVAIETLIQSKQHSGGVRSPQKLSKRSVFNIQHKLKRLGYSVNKTGVVDTRTREAISKLSLDYGLSIAGDYSDLMQLLQKIEAGRLKIKAKPEPVVIPEPVVKPEPVVSPDPVVKPEPVVSPEPVVIPEPVVRPEPVVKPEPAVRPEPVVRPYPILPVVLFAFVFFYISYLYWKGKFLFYPDESVQDDSYPEKDDDNDVAIINPGEQGDSTLLDKAQQRWEGDKQNASSESTVVNPAFQGTEEAWSDTTGSESAVVNPVSQGAEEVGGGATDAEPVQLADYDMVAALVFAIKASATLKAFALCYPRVKISIGKTNPEKLYGLVERWVPSRSVCQPDHAAEWVMSGYCQLVERAYYNHTSVLPVKSAGAWVKPLINPDFWKTEEIYRTDSSKRGFPPDWEYRKEVINWIDSGMCRRCGLKVSDKDKQTHHIKPRAEGGTHEFENLALLCRDCHTFMPGRGHLEIRGYGAFFLSKKKKVHVQRCHYAGNCCCRWANLMTLKAEGYELCKVCDPNAQHQANIKVWRPKILDDLESRRGKIVKELTRYMQDNR